jgi:hypothetical protein
MMRFARRNERARAVFNVEDFKDRYRHSLLTSSQPTQFFTGEVGFLFCSRNGRLKAYPQSPRPHGRQQW